MKRLVVWWDGRVVGQLTQNPHGELGFRYAPEWLQTVAARPLSASLPLRSEAFSRRACRPFFGGLLPEEGQRTAVAQALGVSEANDFALLDHLGGEVAGALQLLPQGSQPRAEAGPFEPRPLADGDLLRIMDLLPKRPMLAGEDGLRLSLAGAQGKLPVVVSAGRILLSAPGQPTTHILKPPIARFSGTTENEGLAMRLAAAVGLKVAPVEPRCLQSTDGTPRTFLLVQRYDRVVDEHGLTRRLHQEDFCQALGVPPERKYQSEGGPGLKDCFNLLREVSIRPAVDVIRLLDAVIFNAAIGNADAHAKNFSLLYGAHGPVLAPLYDLLSTVCYPELSPRFAMKIGPVATLEALDARAWAEFADQAGLGYPLVKRRILNLADSLLKALTPTRETLRNQGLQEVELDNLVMVVKDRTERLRSKVA